MSRSTHPAIIPATILETGKRPQQYVYTVANAYQRRIRETTTKTREDGSVSSDVIHYNEMVVNPIHYSATRMVACASCELPNGSRRIFDIDDTRVSIGETVHIVEHRVLGFSTFDVYRASDRRWFTDIDLPEPKILPPALAGAAFGAMLYLGSNFDNAVILAVVLGLSAHITLHSLRYARIKMLARSRDRAKSQIMSSAA